MRFDVRRDLEHSGRNRFIMENDKFGFRYVVSDGDWTAKW